MASGSGQSLATQVLAQIGGNLSTSFGTADYGSPQAGLVYDAGPAKIGVSTYNGSGASNGATTAASTATQGQRTVVTLDWRFWRNWVLRGRADMGSDQQTIGADVLWQHGF